MTDMPTRTDDLLGAAKEFLEQYYASIKRWVTIFRFSSSILSASRAFHQFDEDRITVQHRRSVTDTANESVKLRQEKWSRMQKHDMRNSGGAETAPLYVGSVTMRPLHAFETAGDHWDAYIWSPLATATGDRQTTWRIAASFFDGGHLFQGNMSINLRYRPVLFVVMETIESDIFRGEERMPPLDKWFERQYFSNRLTFKIGSEASPASNKPRDLSWVQCKFIKQRHAVVLFRNVGSVWWPNVPVLLLSNGVQIIHSQSEYVRHLTWISVPCGGNGFTPSGPVTLLTSRPVVSLIGQLIERATSRGALWVENL